MRDNLIIAAIKSCLDENLPLWGLNDFEVSRSAQPTDQSVSGGYDTTYKTQILLHQISHVIFHDAPEMSGEFMVNNRGARIQFDIIHNFDPSDISELTPDDVAELVSDLLVDPYIIKKLRQDGVRVQERSSIRPLFFVNESERYENMASFDLFVTYETHRYRRIDTTRAVVGDFLIT